MQLRKYLRVAQRRWRVILASLFVTLAAVAVLTMQLTPRYESTAQLFVSTANESGSEALQGNTFAQERVASYAELVKNRELAARVVDKLGLDRSPQELSSQLTATAVPNTVLLDISMTDPSARTAQRIAQAAAEELAQLVNRLETPPGKATAPVTATIVERADLPGHPASPDPVRNLAVAFVLGLLLGIGLAVVRELLDTSIKTGEDVAAVVDASVLGSIPYDESATKRPLLTDLPPQAGRVEAFRILRTNLQFVDVDHTKKIVVVTSSVPGEGKTSTAANTAIALQTAGRRVLLIDGDLRSAELGRRFQLEQAVGLTSVLLGDVTLLEAVQEHTASGLHVLTSGPVPPNPAELLQSRAMTKLVKTLRGAYDIVIIDAPPLLPVTDAAVVSSHVDGAMVVVRHGRTTRDQLVHALERLDGVGARLLGVTLNMVPNRGAEGYGYGYGYQPSSPAPMRHHTGDEGAA